MLNLSAIPSQRGWGKLLRLSLHLVPRSAAVPILQGPLRGKRWIVGAATHGCWLGSYEFQKQRALWRCLRPEDVVYDIGANAGFYTLLCSVVASHVYAFEPLPENLMFLRSHLRLNRIVNCTVLDCALSSRDGEGSFLMEGDRSEGRLAPGGAVRVRTARLDTMIRSLSLQPPTLIKLDIEGAEADCLHGASECIPKYRPTLFLATHGAGPERECLAMLREWGYEIRSLESNEFVATGRQQGASRSPAT